MKFTIILIIAVFWMFFLVTNNVANDFSFLSRGELISRFSLPQIWQERISEGFGQYSLSILWNWPLDLLYGLFGWLGISFSVVELLLFLIPFIVIGYYSSKKFLNYFDIQGLAESSGILFYLLNPYVILLIDGGQLSIALAYSLIPLVFINFVKSLNGGRREKLLAGLSFWVLGFLDIRYIYLCGLIIIIWLLVDLGFRKNRLELVRDFILTIPLTVGIFAVLNFYWITPSLISRAPSLPDGYSDVSQLSELGFTNWKHAVLLQPPNWFKNVFGSVGPINKEFILFPILIILGVFIVKKRSSALVFFAFLTILGISLSKGAAYPFGEIYEYLFTYIPGFSLFRDSTKFFLFTALGYSYFISSLIKWIDLRFKKNKLHYLPFIGFLIYLLFIVRPVWLGQMTGTLSAPVYEDTYRELWKNFEADNNFGRVLWVSAQPPLGYSSPIHPSVELSRLFSKRPFSPGVVGSYETTNFLREAPYMGQLFNVLGIKYIAYPYPDERRQELKPDNINYYYAFSDQMENLDWISGKISDFPVNVFETKSTKDRFFMADNTWIVVGDDGVYSKFDGGTDIKLSDNALIFAEEGAGLVKKVTDGFSVPVVLNNKGKTDYMLSTFDPRYFIFPSEALPDSPGENGWWKRNSGDFIWMRNFMQQKYGIDLKEFDYGGGYAIAEGSKKLVVSSKQSLAGKNGKKFAGGDQLFVRAMNSSKGGLVQFFQGESKIGEINTKIENPERIEIKLTGYEQIPDQYFKYDKAEFEWVEVGKLITNGDLTIKTAGDINIVNTLVSAPENLFTDSLNDMNEGQFIDMNKLSESDLTAMFKADSDTNTSYKRISSTHYEVEIKGLDGPSTLVFSETYDPLWRIYDENGNEGTPYKLYNMVNGFYVEKDGKYDVYFAPQKYVNYGFIISLLGMMAVSSYILLKKD